jgi:hypothetical protein
LVEQRAFGVARVVELGFAVGLCCGGVHHAMPAGFGPRDYSVVMHSICSDSFSSQYLAARQSERYRYLRNCVTAPMLSI